MSPDFWWGVVAATGAWMGVACTTVVGFAWVLANDGGDARPDRRSDGHSE